MGDSSDNVTGLLKRTAELLNKKAFSDVQILVKDGNNHKTFPAHKLFLSMGSQEFANIFYGSGESPSCIKIFDYKPQTVYSMLQYLYTTKLDLSDMEEARELYSLSKKFGIRNLQELCVDYISREINKDNVLHMYENALREKFTRLLTNCRNVVSLNTKTVFDSPSFVEASEGVVEDIFKLNTLTVSSELDVLNAAMKWARYECKRRRLSNDSSNMRECMKGILCHIRFLILNLDEFSGFVKEHNILSAHESFVITRKLLQPLSQISVPLGFCDISSVRGNPLPCSSSSRSVSDSDVKSVKLSDSCIVTNKYQVIRSSLRNSSITPLRFRNSSPHHPFHPDNDIKQNSISQVMPQIQLQKRNLDFSLEEMQKLFSTAFSNDVKCTASIQMLKGVIIIYGIELKINQLENIEERIKVFLSISLSGEKSRNNVHEELLKQGNLAINFCHPVKLIENNSADIEIIVEDLELNRCSIIKNPIYELSYGTDIIADVSLTCNQMNKTGEYFFLIKRLIYSPV